MKENKKQKINSRLLTLKLEESIIPRSIKLSSQTTLEYDAHTTKEPHQHSNWEPSQTPTT